MVAAETAAISDAPMPSFDSFSCPEGFPSTEEHLTLPFVAIAGNPRIGEEDREMGLFCTRPAALVTDEVGVLAVMVAISLSVGEEKMGL